MNEWEFKEMCIDIQNVIDEVLLLDRTRETSLAVTKIQEAFFWLKEDFHNKSIDSNDIDKV